MADLYGVAIGGGLTGNVDANARKLVGEGTSGVGPYTKIGGVQLQAISVISATLNFATSYTTANSNFAKAVLALQSLSEIYYVGIPSTQANGFVALVRLNGTDAGDGYGATSSADGSYENIEDAIGAAVGTAENDITVVNMTLTGKVFA
jgi:hypothetical protein